MTVLDPIDHALARDQADQLGIGGDEPPTRERTGHEQQRDPESPAAHGACCSRYAHTKQGAPARGGIAWRSIDRDVKPDVGALESCRRAVSWHELPRTCQIARKDPVSLKSLQRLLGSCTRAARRCLNLSRERLPEWGARPQPRSCVDCLSLRRDQAVPAAACAA